MSLMSRSTCPGCGFVLMHCLCPAGVIDSKSNIRRMAAQIPDDQVICKRDLLERAAMWIEEAIDAHQNETKRYGPISEPLVFQLRAAARAGKQ